MFKFSAQSRYLSFKESVVITLLPAVVFLLNGFLVIFLKTIEAPIMAYTVLPIILLSFFVLTIMLGLKNDRSRIFDSVKKYGPIVMVPATLAVLHLYIYGTSFGTDTAAYYTNPMHTFFSVGHFSHSEAPFVEFGHQPLAIYWLPANSEFMFAGIGKVFDLEYHQILGLMHLSTNFCLGLVLFATMLRFLNLPNAVVICVSLFFLIYGLQNTRLGFEATALFRGFENKGFIWGYFFWASLTIFIPGFYTKVRPLHWVGAGLVLGAASFLVSGNAALLLFPVTALFLGAIISKQFDTLFPYVGFYVGLIGLIFILKMLEVTNVYSVVTTDLTPRIPDSYDIQVPSFAFPLWLWALAGIATLSVAVTQIKLAIQLGVFLGLSMIIQTEAYFNLCLEYSMEFTLVFWRHASLMTPFVPFVFGGLFLLSQVEKPRIQSTLSLGLLGICGLGYLTGTLNLPDKSPFTPAAKQPVMTALSRLCPEGSLILAQIGFATQMPVIQPKYDYLGARQAFLNWQIANLPLDSDIRQQATDVRDSLSFLKRDRLTGEFPSDTGAIERTIEANSPDAIFLTRSRVTDENKHIFAGYNRQRYKGTVAFTKDTCRSDFEKLVQSALKE